MWTKVTLILKPSEASNSSRAIKHITHQNSMTGISKDGTTCMMVLKWEAVREARAQTAYLALRKKNNCRDAECLQRTAMLLSVGIATAALSTIFS